MKIVHMLVPTVASTFCVATSVFAQGTPYARPRTQFVTPPVITYGTPRVVQSTPITAYLPVVSGADNQTPAGDQATIVTNSPVTEGIATPITQSGPVVTYYYPVVPMVTSYRPVVRRGVVVGYRPFIQATQVDISGAVVAYRPMLSGVAPVAAYRPVIGAPVVTYRVAPNYAAPVLGPTGVYYSPTALYPVGRTVIVWPKVYVSGQPIRNILRAITP